MPFDIPYTVVVYLCVGALMVTALALLIAWVMARDRVEELEQTLKQRRAEFTVLKEGATAAGRLLAVINKPGHIVTKAEAQAVRECRAMLVDMCALDDDGV